MNSHLELYVEEETVKFYVLFSVARSVIGYSTN